MMNAHPARAKDDPWALLERILEAQGGRRNRDGAVVHCLQPDNHNHGDRHPSLRLTVKNGRMLMFCDVCGSNAALIEAARARGLWSSERHDVRRPQPFSWEAYLRAHRIEKSKLAPACCFQQPPQCELWKKFDADLIIATLFSSLRDAAQELVDKAARGRMYDLSRRNPDASMTTAELVAGLGFAIEFGSIVPPGIDESAVARAIAIVAEKSTAGRRAA